MTTLAVNTSIVYFLGRFARDLLGGFIFAQAVEGRVPQPSVSGTINLYMLPCAPKITY